MRKLVAIIILLLPFLSNAQPGNKKNSFYVSSGYMSSSYIKEAIVKEITTNAATHNHHKHNCILLNAGYLYRMSEQWRVGVSFTYDHFGVEDRSVEYHAYNYLVRTERIWKETPAMQLYSGLSAGVQSLKSFGDKGLQDSKVTACYQVNIMGASVKIYDQFFLDGSFGFGVSGILNGGLVYRF